ncbi:hypothetical protein C8A03DRAFT_45268 [Achaetomium macrosporum]|uniref:F-box domain-containing protein n=1 Tax=Achaetomium macrosporum TaxID=79813 RepID=A0AAN7C7G6_9PEZI|nr:hypothetical protein C8A03DRAFT_45268 [Achaetomium macrosporum]
MEDPWTTTMAATAAAAVPRPLHALTPASLGALTSLKVVLNQSSCHQWTDSDSYPWDSYPPDSCPTCSHSGQEDVKYPFGAHQCKRYHGDRHSFPLLSPRLGGDDDERLAAAQVLLSEWHSAAAYVSAHIGSDRRLELALVCDIDPPQKYALDIAKCIVTPLRLLPPLKACHIRLGETADAGLSQPAQDAVQEACRIAIPYLKPSSTLTTFSTLPRELRLQILEYTDLITPWKEVIWNRQQRAYMLSCTPCVELCDFAFRPLGIHHRPGVAFGQCWPGDHMGCFCRRRHASFSIPGICQCWAPPGPDLFLICRSLYQDAQLVFFSANRFVVHDFDARFPARIPGIVTGYYLDDCFAASHFLREVVPVHSLAYIRFLELVFPPYEWHSPTPEGSGKLLRAYGCILRPLKQLATRDNRLARFYTRFNYPTHVHEDMQVKERKALKAAAVRTVMGDRYNSLYANNKSEPPPSVWELVIDHRSGIFR